MASNCRNLLLICVAGVGLAGCAITAEPLTDAELASAADENLANVTAEQEPIRGRVGLFDAMARALKYNLDHKVEVYQAALRYEELDVARFELLPDLVAKSDFARRDNFSASVTRQVVNGDLGPAGAFQTFNTSQDRSRRNADIEFSWHVLDFGLSYVRARQAADKALVAEEARRKVVNRVIEDVRT
ncbi:MAG: TolC family protein, partial [Pseudomonadota bacterium]